MLCIAIPYCLSIIPFLSAVPSFSFAFVLPFLSFLFNFFRAFPFSVSYFIPSVPFHLSVVIWRKSLSCFYKMSFFKSHVTFLLFFWVCHLRFRSLYMYILLIFLFQPFYFSFSIYLSDLSKSNLKPCASWPNLANHRDCTIDALPLAKSMSTASCYQPMFPRQSFKN